MAEGTAEMKNNCCIILVFLMLLSAAPASGGSFFSQFIDSKDGKLDTSQWRATGTGFLTIPIIVSDPAVGYGGGLALAFFHESKNEQPGKVQILRRCGQGLNHFQPLW
jgi:hypothetical protein